jgi:hypothetical protein
LEYNLILIKLEGDFIKLTVILVFLANVISAKFKGFSQNYLGEGKSSF